MREPEEEIYRSIDLRGLQFACNHEYVDYSLILQGSENLTRLFRGSNLQLLKVEQKMSI